MPITAGGPAREASPQQFHVNTDPKIVGIQSVIENVLDKLIIMTHLREDENGETAVIQKALEERKKVEEGYKHLLEQRQECKLSGEEKTSHSALEDESHHLIDQYHDLRQSLAVSSAVTADGRSSNAIKSLLRKEKIKMVELLRQALDELSVKGECSSLRAYVKQQRDCEMETNELQTAIKSHTTNIVKLERAVEKSRAEHKAESAENEKKVAGLKAVLRSKKDSLDTTEQEYYTSVRANLNMRERQCNIEEENMRKKVQELRLQLAMEKKSNTRINAFYKKKTGKVKDDLATWTKRYDDDVSSITKKLEDLGEEREKTLSQLHDKEEEFEVEANAKAVREESERLREAEITRKREAAIMIQCCWRQFSARKTVKKLVSEKKKASKKGKKGKKK